MGWTTTINVWTAIDALPEKLRVVIVLASIEGHDVREVAVLLRIPEGTVKSRLFLARQKLKKALRSTDQELDRALANALDVEPGGRLPGPRAHARGGRASSVLLAGAMADGRGGRRRRRDCCSADVLERRRRTADRNGCTWSGRTGGGGGGERRACRACPARPFVLRRHRGQ